MPEQSAHPRFWQARITRQHEIDRCMAVSADPPNAFVHQVHPVCSSSQW